jgi:hypothetical protein
MPFTELRAPSALAVIGALVLVGLAILLARLLTAQPDTQTLTGAVVFVDTDRAQFDRDVHGGFATSPPHLAPASDCVAAVLALSLMPGQPVTLQDEAGKIIGRGSLGIAEPMEDAEPAAERYRDCRISFIVEGVAPSRTVTLDLGADRRRTYTTAELDARAWNVELRLDP